MLRHALPHGDEAVLLDRALTALLADLARSKFAATDRPRPSSGPTGGSRHISAEVRRAVWLRDLGRCAYVAGDGRRCNERAFVEFHHCRPYAIGGAATVENIQLRCRRHNDYEARLFFARGDDGGARDVVGARDIAGARGVVGARDVGGVRELASARDAVEVRDVLGPRDQQRDVLAAKDLSVSASTRSGTS
jgi:hypothetical protein